MENDAKMEAEWRPISLENLKICEKTAWPKSMLNFDVEKRQTLILKITESIDPGVTLSRFLSGLGGLGGSRIQAKTSG